MKEETFEEIIRCIKLPVGKLLEDGKTFRVTSDDFHKIKTPHIKELCFFDKFLVLTYNEDVAGGVLFYGSTDIQVITLPEHRGKHIMSEIHKNGILKSECYPNQKVSVSKQTIESFDDFMMKHYLLSNAGLKISNLSEIFRYLKFFEKSNEFCAIKKYDESDFLQDFS